VCLWALLPDLNKSIYLSKQEITAYIREISIVSNKRTGTKTKSRLLASCLINAQRLPAHHPAADDDSLIGCTSHDLTDDWSLPMPILLTVNAHFAARLGAFFYRTRFI